MKKYPLALYIGRFQPFHKGHLYSLRKAMEVGEKVLIGIGSSNVSDENNPWDYRARERMLEAVVKAEGVEKAVVEVVPVPDDPSDEVWAEQVVERVREYGYEPGQVVSVGNNDWTNEWLAKTGMGVYESGLHNRDELEGVKIRKMMRGGDEGWKLRVPEEVVSKIYVSVV